MSCLVKPMVVLWPQHTWAHITCTQTHTNHARHLTQWTCHHTFTQSSSWAEMVSQASLYDFSHSSCWWCIQSSDSNFIPSCVFPWQWWQRTGSTLPISVWTIQFQKLPSNNTQCRHYGPWPSRYHHWWKLSICPHLLSHHLPSHSLISFPSDN